MSYSTGEKMKKLLQSGLPAFISVVILAAVLGAGATAGDRSHFAVSIPNHSIGWSKLTRKLQKRIVGGRRFAASGRQAQLISGPVGQPGNQGKKGETGQQGPAGTIDRRCELVEGECLIYTDDFWRLQHALEPFEIDIGVYPEPPLWMKAAAEDRADACGQVVSHLYPDGTLGDEPWVLDPNAPNGWRLFWEGSVPAVP